MVPPCQGPRASAPLTRPTLASPRPAPARCQEPPLGTASHGRTTASPRGKTSGHGSTSSKCRLSREAGGHLLQLRYRREESCSLSRTHAWVCTYLHFGRKFWSWRAKLVPSRRRWLGFPPGSSAYRPRGLHFGMNRLGRTVLRTKRQRQDRRTFT